MYQTDLFWDRFISFIYNNDLPGACEEAKVVKFAGDTTMIKPEERVDPLREWISSIKLRVNPENCKAMCFGYGKPDTIKLGFSELNYKTYCWYLGIHLDKKLLFREHIDYVVKKLNEFCGLIDRAVTFIHGNVFFCYITLLLNQLSAMIYWFIVVQRKPIYRKLNAHRGDY